MKENIKLRENINSENGTSTRLFWWILIDFCGVFQIVFLPVFYIIDLYSLFKTDFSTCISYWKLLEICDFT